MSEPTPPKVFISYSWTDQAHKDWVVSFATRLRECAVDVVADFWDLKLGDDCHAYMERMVTDKSVNFVLAVCDKKYAEKADSRTGGVGKESVIISAKIYGSMTQSKFIPVICEKDEQGKWYVPTFFDGRYHADFTEDEQFEAAFEDLIRHLYHRPALQKPALGIPPAYLFEDKAVRPLSAGKLDRLKHLVTNGKAHVLPALNDFLNTLADSLEEFRVEVPDCSITYDGVRELVVAGFKRFLPSRDLLVDFTLFASDYITDDAALNALHAFWVRIAPLTEPPGGGGGRRDATQDGLCLIVYDLFLHFIAAFVSKKKYHVAARFIEDEYGYSAPHRAYGYVSADIYTFSRPLALFDNRNGTRTGGVIAAHADKKGIRFDDLIQADLIMFIRPWFPNPGKCGRWYARCISSDHQFNNLPLFSAAVAERGFAALRELLKVKTPAEYGAAVAAMESNEAFRSWAGTAGQPFLFQDIQTMLNAERIARGTNR